MYYIFYPTKDSTIYEKYPLLNTGMDPMLELSKEIISSQSIDVALNSRIVIQFDTDLIRLYQSSSVISSSATSRLQLYTNSTKSLPEDFTINVHPLIITTGSIPADVSWNMGLGLRRYYPSQSNGINWSSKGVSTFNAIDNAWNTSSFSANTTGSWNVTPGGGNWYTNSIASQSFVYEISNLDVDVTSIVNNWVTESIINHGFIIKRADADERSTANNTQIGFYSRDTNTIYSPRLIVSWNDSIYTTSSASTQFDLTGSNTPSDLKLWCLNNEMYLHRGGVHTFRVAARKKYPQRTFSTSSAFLSNYRLPSSSSYSIIDEATNDIIIPFSEASTLSYTEALGHFFKVPTQWMQPIRWYRVLVQCNWSDGTQHVYDEDILFRIDH